MGNKGKIHLLHVINDNEKHMFRWVRDFFWFCSGAQVSILKRCPSENNKYAGIGGTVLFTGIFAAISSSFALYTIFNNYYLSVGFGIIWGAMIFNLDRFIVSSMKKEKGLLREIYMALPRLMLAVLLAFVISKPLELKIFEKEIMRAIDEKKLQQIETTRESAFRNFAELQPLEQQVSELKEEIKEKESFRNQKQLEYDQERFGVDSESTSGKPGIGRNARIKEQQLMEAQNALDQTREINLKKITQIEARIQSILDQRDLTIADQSETIENYDGFAARIDALGKLTEQSKYMYWANVFIILLFIAVETAPVFVKILSPKGPYDILLEKHEQTITAEAKLKIRQMMNENKLATEIGNQTLANKLKIQRQKQELQTSQISDAEEEITKISVARWKEKRINEVKDDILPHDIIQLTGQSDQKENTSPVAKNGNGYEDHHKNGSDPTEPDQDHNNDTRG